MCWAGPCVGPNGQILVAMPLPSNYSADAARHRAEPSNSTMTSASSGGACAAPISATCLLLTVGVLFASTWLALYLSKMVTRPLLALAEATQEISRGRLDYRVDVQVGSEIGQLVNSFNQMAADLEASRASIEASRADLADVNVQLEQRNRHIETILESIPTGVLSLDASRHVIHMNGAVQRLLHLDRRRRPRRETLRELFPEDVTADLEHLMRKADRMGTTTSQMEIVTSRVKLNVAVTVASLDSPRPRRTARRSAWDTWWCWKTSRSCCAPKNRLPGAKWRAAWPTRSRIRSRPSRLSAERIRRHLERGTPPTRLRCRIIRNCADTIGSSVQTVRTLVDEFATLARFPASRPMPSDINSIVESALLMFDGRLSGIRVQTFLAAGPASGACGPRRDQARDCESGGQRRRGHAGVNGQGDRDFDGAGWGSAIPSRSWSPTPDTA